MPQLVLSRPFASRSLSIEGRTGSFIVALAFVLAGCQPSKPAPADATPKPSPSTSADSSSPKEAASGAPSSPAISPAGEGSLPTPVATAGQDPQIRPLGNTHTIKQAAPLPNQPGTGGWIATKMAPTLVAGRIDAAFNGLAGVQSESKIHVVIPAGEGFATTACKWFTPKTYEIQYIGLEGSPERIVLYTVRASSGQVKVIAPKPANGGSPHALSLSSGDSAELVSHWPTDFSKLVMSRFFNGQSVFASLVAGLVKPGSGYTVRTEERSTPYRGTTVKNYRIIAERPAAVAKKLGPSEIEIVVDGVRFLPVTLRTRYGPKGKPATEIDWATRWGPAKLTPDEFKL